MRDAGRGRGGGDERVEDSTEQEEGYTEPPYITRQRCLVLNDWAVSLFEVGEYTKVIGLISGM